MGNNTKIIILLGAAPDTGNLGVSALCYSFLNSIYEENMVIYLGDHGKDVREDKITINHREIPIKRFGINLSKRIYRKDNLWVANILSFLGFYSYPLLKIFLRASVIFDISGGDSFTDLYGKRRFLSMILPKLITIRLKKPLVLLPQTYGPFQNTKNFTTAKWICQKSHTTLARDEKSYKILESLLAEQQYKNRSRCTVDLAFSLPTSEDAKADRQNLKTVIGININGLLINSQKSHTQFQFNTDYKDIIVSLIKEFCNREVFIYLTPHVLVPLDHHESDLKACYTILEELPSSCSKFIKISPEFKTPSEAKGFISSMDWFCGSRMHSTIAALSSGVPCTAIAYSDKTQGVFETCGQGDYVADPRSMSKKQIIDKCIHSFENRETQKTSLNLALQKMEPKLLEQREIFKEIINQCSTTK